MAEKEQTPPMPSEHQAYAVPVEERAENARRYYEKLADLTHEWWSIIPQAIDAWEREQKARAAQTSQPSASDERTGLDVHALLDAADYFENKADEQRGIVATPGSETADDAHAEAYRFDRWARACDAAASMAERLEEWRRAALQARADLTAAPVDLGLPSDTRWVEWSSQANTIRWIDRLAAQRTEQPSASGNEYRPWESEGVTEAEYWQARYIEARQEVARLGGDDTGPSASGREVVERHRRHVEQSPGVGTDAQRYALAVLDDVLADLGPSGTESGR